MRDTLRIQETNIKSNALLQSITGSSEKLDLDFDQLERFYDRTNKKPKRKLSKAKHKHPTQDLSDINLTGFTKKKMNEDKNDSLMSGVSIDD